jgi:hypothetical protein
MAYTTINKGSSYFNTVIYSGNGTNPTSITTVGFKPDWLWIKCRSNAASHCLFDAVRGPSKRLISNSDAAESTETQIASFDTNGWTMDADTANNGSGRTYVAWNWLASNTTTSNTSGSITSTVSVNTTAGFSIVSYTGTGSNATVGHGLGVAPDFLIIKNRTGANSWPVWSRSYGNAGVMFLDLQNTPPDTNSVFLNGTTPTSSVFSIGTAGHVNTSASNYIAYVFNSVKGFSKFGKYTGNASTDGTFIYTGFKPAFILIKRSDSNADWYLQDNVRNQNFNGDPKTLQPNNASTEATIGTWSIDNLSNGFKIRESNAAVNASGGTYIYMAFAQNPFVTSGGIPVTAR